MKYTFNTRDFPDDTQVKNLPANAGNARYVGLIPGWKDPPE